MSTVERVVGGALLHVPHPHHGRPDRGAASAAINPTAVLVTACATVFMIAVNTTAINTALNSIAEDVGLSPGELGWSVSVYLLAVAAFVVLGGGLGDMFGELRAMVAGLSVFAVGAVFVATSDSAWMTILGRGLQGTGSALMMPASMAILRVAYPPDRQGFALGVWGAVAGLGFALGPLIGGVLTDAVSWRWVWWLTLVAAMALIAGVLSTLRGLPRPTERPKLDLAGTILLALSTFTLILAIQQGPDWGWGSPKTIGAFVAAVAGTCALVAVESRRKAPLLHLGLLRNPALIAANLGTMVNAFALIGVLFFFNLYAQSIVTLDYSAIGASLALLPYGLCVFGASLQIGRLCDRAGFRWPIAAGLALLGIGSLFVSRVNGDSGYGDIWWATVIMGIGVGMTFSAPSAAGLRAVSAEHAGEASGIINVVRYVGAALIVSLGTIAFTQVASDDLNSKLDTAGVGRLEDRALDHVLTGAPSQVEAAENRLAARDRPAFRAGAGEGVAQGFGAVMLGLGVVSLAAAVLWWVLMRPRAP